MTAPRKPGARFGGKRKAAKPMDFDSLVRRCANRAAMLIRIHGWNRGMRGGGRGRNGEVCAVNAINDAADQIVPGDQKRRDHIAIVVRIRAERVIDPNGRHCHRPRRKKYLAYWNDKTGQTVDIGEVMRQEAA